MWDPRDGEDLDDSGTLTDAERLDASPCIARNSSDRQADTDRAARQDAATSAAGFTAHPDGNADNYESVITDAGLTQNNRAVIDGADDFYKCSEDDGGDDPGADSDDPNSICDADWVNDVTITFADGTFGCTTTRDVTITCTWDADGGMAQGRNALPDSFIGQGDNSNLGHFLKCTAS